MHLIVDISLSIYGIKTIYIKQNIANRCIHSVVFLCILRMLIGIDMKDNISKFIYEVFEQRFLS